MAPTTKASISTKINRQKCEEWVANPSINPFTGRTIQRETIKPGVYQWLLEACEKYGIVPPGHVGNRATPNLPGPSTAIPLPKTVGGIPVPSTVEEWKVLTLKIQLYVGVVDRYSFYDKNDKKKIESFIKLLLLTKRPEMPTIDPVLVDRLLGDLTNILNKPALTVQKHQLEPQYIEEQIRRARIYINTYLIEGSYANYTDVANWVITAKEFAQLMAYRSRLQIIETTFQVTEDFTRLQGKYIHLLHQCNALEEILQEIADNNNTKSATRSLRPSKSRKTPSSMSSTPSSSKSRNYDSSFHRHSALSVMTDIEESPSLPPLPSKTRQQLLKELKAACLKMEDYIYKQRFDRLPKKHLQLMVQLGEDGKKKRCYYVRDLYNMWKIANDKNKPFVDVNRNPITKAEKDMIMEKVRYIDKNAKDLRENTKQKNSKLYFHYENVNIRVQIDGAEVPLPFYEISMRRRFGELVYIIRSLGYIPANIDSDDTGSTDLTSEVLLAKLHILAEQGRIMTSNTAPYTCCRMHFKYDAQYWVDADASKMISIRRMQLMKEEIDQLLDE